MHWVLHRPGTKYAFIVQLDLREWNWYVTLCSRIISFRPGPKFYVFDNLNRPPEISYIRCPIPLISTQHNFNTGLFIMFWRKWIMKWADPHHLYERRVMCGTMSDTLCPLHVGVCNWHRPQKMPHLDILYYAFLRHQDLWRICTTGACRGARRWSHWRTLM